jgi:WD40 repeat protein
MLQPATLTLTLTIDGEIETGIGATLLIKYINLGNNVQGEQYADINITGKLPPNFILKPTIDEWRDIYYSLSASRIIQIPVQENTCQDFFNKQYQKCRLLEEKICAEFNTWLLSESFRPIREKCLVKIDGQDEVQISICSSNQDLLKLPWNSWDLIEQYAVEVGLSFPDFKSIPENKLANLPDPVRILAILGDSTDIDTDGDRRLLEDLPNSEIKFLNQPRREKINNQLWEDRWDILFFAGHSKTEGQQGKIFINSEESLTIANLKYALQKAVDRGLKLAIFNSCDGLGLAFELQQLCIPQIIVMREPVPDEVAQVFLKEFLSEFSIGQSLYQAIRNARTKLHGLEDRFPWASSLPIVINNPAVETPLWPLPLASEVEKTSLKYNLERQKIKTAQEQLRKIQLERLKLRIKGILQNTRLKKSFAKSFFVLGVFFPLGVILYRQVVVGELEQHGDSINASTLQVKKLEESLKAVKLLKYNSILIPLIPNPLRFDIKLEKKLTTLEGHTSGMEIHTANFSPDSKIIATASADRTAKLWSLDGKEIQTLRGHKDRVWDIRFSPKNDLISTASWDGTIKLWSWDKDLKYSELITTLRSDRDGIFVTSFTQKNSVLISAGKDRKIRIWSLENKKSKLIREWDSKHIKNIVSLKVHPKNDNIIITGSDDGTAKLWSLNGKLIQTFKGHTTEVNDASFSPDGKIIATASDDKTIKLWTLRGEEIRTLSGHTAQVITAEFSPDGRSIVSASLDNTVKIWNIDGTLIKTIPDDDSSQKLSANFSPDGKKIVFSNAKGLARFISLKNITEPKKLNLEELLQRGCNRLPPDRKRDLTFKTDKVCQ